MATTDHRVTGGDISCWQLFPAAHHRWKRSLLGWQQATAGLQGVKEGLGDEEAHRLNQEELSRDVQSRHQWEGPSLGVRRLKNHEWRPGVHVVRKRVADTQPMVGWACISRNDLRLWILLSSVRQWWLETVPEIACILAIWKLYVLVQKLGILHFPSWSLWKEYPHQLPKERSFKCESVSSLDGEFQKLMLMFHVSEKT